VLGALIVMLIAYALYRFCWAANGGPPHKEKAPLTTPSDAQAPPQVAATLTKTGESNGPSSATRVDDADTRVIRSGASSQASVTLSYIGIRDQEDGRTSPGIRAGGD
jgi:hypothetical protein